MTIRTTRRILLGGIGAGLAMTLTGSATARAPRQRKLGYAIVGLGNYATNQIMPRLAKCRYSRLSALVSGTPEKLERYGREYGIPATHHYSYDRYAEMRDNSDIDIVYVVLPNSMHAEYTIRAARAGKHVMCEKPMAVSVAECEAMIAACRTAGRKLMIGYRSRFQPHNKLAIELAQGGHVGPMRIITSAHGFNIQPDQWRLEKELSGGGSLMDIGIYSLNAARYLAGEEPVLVSAIESTDRSDPRFATVEDRIDFHLRFPSGVLASCISSYSSNHNDYRVTGRDGWIELDPATSYGGQAMQVRRDGKTEDRTPPPQDHDQFIGQLDHFAQCILEDRVPIVAGEEGLADLKVIEAIYRSAREGRQVEL